MSFEVEKAMKELREFMFENVYRNPKAKSEEIKAKSMLIELFGYYMKHTQDMSKEYRDMIEIKNENVERVVCDYIAGMTDQYAMSRFAQYFMPNSWKIY